MANPEHVELVKSGTQAVHDYYVRSNPRITPVNAHLEALDEQDRLDLSGARLSSLELSSCNLSGIDFSNAELLECDFSQTFCTLGSFAGSSIRRGRFRGAMLTDCDFTSANFLDCQFGSAMLHGIQASRTNFRGSIFHSTQVFDSSFESANFDQSVLAHLTLARSDFSNANGLSSCHHLSLSVVDYETLMLSIDTTPIDFWQRTGKSRYQILQAKMLDPALSAAEIADLQSRVFRERTKGPQFMSAVFISYSHTNGEGKNDRFVQRFEKRLFEDGISVWRDEHDLVGGPIVRQIHDQINKTGSVVLVLDKNSVNSDWVKFEIKKARDRERRENRHILCPVALDDSWKSKNDPTWEYLKETYNIIDFSEWKKKKKFDEAMVKLIKGLRLYYQPKSEKGP